MRRYPEYKDSGVGWIGEIPNYWQTATIKHLTGNLDGRRVPLSGEVRTGQKPIYPYYGANGVIDYVEDYIFEGEHILIGEDGAPFFDKTREVSMLASGNFWVNNHCHILKNTGKSEARFIVYCLNSVDYFEYITGSTRDKLTQADLNRIKIAVPPKQEQTQISHFLDRKTEQIDELIRIKERKVELLREQRTALINQAVTKGLNPHVAMKPSSVEWIGEIPAHWTISKVKYEFESLDNSRVPLNAETRGRMKLKVYDYYGASGVIDTVEDYIFDKPLILIGEDGANLYLRSTPLAFKATGKYWVNNHAHVLRPKHGNIDYLTNLLESLDYSHYITGAAQPKLTSEHLMNITVVIPPTPEQTQIANVLGRKTAQVDERISVEQRSIELLKEYRQSLISDAVTGKIDIRCKV